MNRVKRSWTVSKWLKAVSKWLRAVSKRLRTVAALLSYVCALLMTSPSMATDIRIVGLFNDRALLEVNGKQHLLRVGQTSPEGIKLVSSNSKQAVIEANGKRDKLGLSQHIAASFSKAEGAEVNLSRGPHGHYFGHGAINGYPVKFMVDTGATSIAMNLGDAKRLGVKIDRKNRAVASTAGGLVDTYSVVFNKVSIGGITRYKIKGAVIDGLYPENILLGNTFLSTIEMSEHNGVMILRER